MMKKYLLLLFFIHLFLLLHAQVETTILTDDIQNDIFESVEEQIVIDEDILDYTDELEVVLKYQNSKVNVNDMPPEVASTLLHLSDYQYYQLQLYIELYGELKSVYELAAVDGFSRKEVERLFDKIEVLPVKNRKFRFVDLFCKVKGMFLFRYGRILEKQLGYQKKSEGYLGTPASIACKLSLQATDQIAIGLTAEKDAGEQFFRGTQKQGFDHYSFFINVKNVGVLKNFVIGDYTLNFGQGLIQGARSMGNKGGGADQIRQFPTLLRAKASMNEGSYLRGGAIVVGNAYYSGTIFYSHRFMDGQCFVDSTGKQIYKGSLMNNGYHRTQNEIANRNTVMNRTIGAHFQMYRRIWELGITTVFNQFSKEVILSSDLYKKYNFSGKQVLNLGADFKLILRKTIFFGEIAVSKNYQQWGSGCLLGGIFSINPISKVSTLFRYYGRQYIAIQGNSFGEGKGCNNELGLYIATDVMAGAKTTLQLYMDAVYFPWLRFQVDMPSYGFEMGAKCSINFTKYISLNLKYKYVGKWQNVKESVYYTSTSRVDKYSFRWTLKVLPKQWLKLNSEVDWIITKGVTHQISQGVVFFQDIGISIDKWGLGINGRFCIFNTDSYDDRIYAYENDLLYSFTINAHYGKGIRYYVMLNYKYSFFSIQIRFAQTFFDDRSFISSGLTRINGNRRSEIRAQVVFHIN